MTGKITHFPKIAGGIDNFGRAVIYRQSGRATFTPTLTICIPHIEKITSIIWEVSNNGQKNIFILTFQGENIQIILRFYDNAGEMKRKLVEIMALAN